MLRVKRKQGSTLRVPAHRRQECPNEDLPTRVAERFQSILSASRGQGHERFDIVLTREMVVSRSLGGVAQLVERLTGSQEVRGFEPHRLHRKVLVMETCSVEIDWGNGVFPTFSPRRRNPQCPTCLIVRRSNLDATALTPPIVNRRECRLLRS